jgi:hypothetical protein
LRLAKPIAPFTQVECVPSDHQQLRIGKDPTSPGHKDRFAFGSGGMQMVFVGQAAGVSRASPVSRRGPDHPGARPCSPK